MHNLLRCATHSGCENKVVKTRNSASANPKGLISCSIIVVISRPRCIIRRHSKISVKGTSGMGALNSLRFMSNKSN